MSAEPPKDSVQGVPHAGDLGHGCALRRASLASVGAVVALGTDRSEESAQVAFEFCLEQAGGPGLEEAQRRLGIHTLEELDANRDAFAEVFFAASPKPDSPQALFSQVAIGVACVLAGTALVMAACEKLGEDLEAMREDVLYAQRQVEDLESMHEIRDVLSSQE